MKEESEKVGLKLSVRKSRIMGIWSHHFKANRWGNNGNSERLFFLAPKSLQMVTATMKLRHLLLERKAMTNLDSILKSRDLCTQGPSSQSYGFSSSHVWMYGCESWTIKKAEHLRTDTFELWLEKTLESPLDSKEIQPVHPKGNQSWIFIGRTDAEAPTLCHLMQRTDSLEKILMLEKIEGGRRGEWQRMRW